MTTAHKIKLGVIAALLVIQALYAGFVTQPAHFTVDEGVYHMMARSLVQDGSLAVLPHYAETPSEELIYALLLVDQRDPSKPRLVPQYPSGYAFVAAPFYAIGGFAGLFWINVLAYLGTVWAMSAVAVRLYRDRAVAMNAILFLTLGTFIWEYVQGVWPHSFSMFLTTAAVLAGLVALDNSSPNKATSWAALAGLIVGFAAGIRYDAIMVGPALALPFLFATPIRVRPVVGFVVGLIPGLVLLALTNEAKFGTLSPFTYGTDSGAGAQSLSGYTALAAGACGVVLLVWVATRTPVRNYFRYRSVLLAASAIAVVSAALILPQFRNLCLRLLEGAWEIVVDLRYRPDIAEWGVSRTATGGLAYGEWLKKALIQSCPWLVLLGVPLAAWIRRPDPRQAVPLLTIGAFIALYGYQRWHGGFSLNMRYFISFLPLAAILASLAWRDLSENLPHGWRRAVTGIGFASVVIWIPLIVSDPTLSIEPILLNTPLIIAAALAIALIARMLPVKVLRPGAGLAAMGLAATGLAWGFSVSFAYDLPRSTLARAFNYQIGSEIRPLIEPDSLLFTRYASRVSLLIDDDIRLAFPRNDEFADFRRLLNVNMAQGRAVYLAFSEEYWEQVEAENLLAGLETLPLYENGDVRLVRVRDPQHQRHEAQ